MCINKEYSLLALVVSYTVGGFLIYRNHGLDRWNAISLIAFSSMQLLDFLLWLLHDTGNFTGLPNLIISKYLIPIFLSSIIICVYIGSQLYKNGNKLGGLGNRLLADITNPNRYYPKILILFAVVTCVWSISKSDQTVVGSEGNLVWGHIIRDGIRKYIIGILFIFFLIYPYLEYFFSKTLVTVIVTYIALTLGYSFVKGAGWGSYWCWIANFLAVIMLMDSK